MSTNLAFQPLPSATVNNHAARAKDLETKHATATKGELAQYRGALFRMLDAGVVPATPTTLATFSLSKLQEFLTEWQASNPGYPGFFLSQMQRRSQLFEADTKGSAAAAMAVLPPGFPTPFTFPTYTINPEGSVTIETTATP